MKFLKSFVKNANVLNIILTATIIALAAGIAITALRMRQSYVVPRIKEKPAVAEPMQTGQPAKMPSDYALIGEANLFHPDRNIPVDKKTEVPRPEITLYGTLIDSDRIAFIEDKKNPVTTPGRGSRQRAVHKGETVSGYIVTDIMTDRITLARGDDKFTVMLSQPDKRKGDAAGAPTTGAPVPPRQGTQDIAPQSPGTQVPPSPAGRPGVSGNRRTPQVQPGTPRPRTVAPTTPNQPPARSAPPE
ncbi:MAG: hypothetical protein ACYDHW_02825 [Syntrophorhabdaceae bacterium]